MENKMNNKNNGICCGGDYTTSTKPIDQNAHQGSPSKRHNADKEAERIRLANYIAIYVQNHIAGVQSLSALIYEGIGQFYDK
jgi:hypothetical protein